MKTYKNKRKNPLLSPVFHTGMHIYPKRVYQNNYNQPVLYARDKMEVC